MLKREDYPQCCRDRIGRSTSICQTCVERNGFPKVDFATSAEAPRSTLNSFTGTFGTWKEGETLTHQASFGHSRTPVHLTVGDDQQHKAEVFEEPDDGT